MHTLLDGFIGAYMIAILVAFVANVAVVYKSEDDTPFEESPNFIGYAVLVDEEEGR